MTKTERIAEAIAAAARKAITGKTETKGEAAIRRRKASWF